MGQFSWCCALCDEEVMHGRQPGYQWTTDAVILWPNGDRRTGRYEDGYGVIAGVDLVEQLGGWRLVHQRCFDNMGPLDSALPADELFGTFHKDRHASDQGWWPGERVAVKRYGEPDLSELTDKTYFCRLCLRSWEAKWSGGACPFGCVRPKHFEISPEDLVNPEMAHWFNEDSGAELVEPFRLSYGLETADGLVRCHNEYAERPNWKLYHEMKERPDSPPTKVEPCFRFGDLQQARITKPKEWDEFERPERGEFVVRCQSCKSDNVEIVPLTSGEQPPKVTEG